MFLGLFVCGLVQAESSLPKCKGKFNKWTNCYGTKESKKGHKYVGEFLNGKFHGQGTYTYANGDKYVGEWEKGKKNGQGIFTFISGKIEEGVWKKDKLVTPK